MGSTAQTGKDGKTNVCIGVWSTNEEEECSSNWKEFGNVVDDLEKEGREGRLDKLIVFFMTDSSTVEGAVDKESTPWRALFEHVLQIKRIQFKYKFVLHVAPYSGTRMTLQGTDGVSRGILNPGLL